ncbi:MAG: hypothetical protein FWF69_06840, partial [Firmicutes bacterium]|nr:hypothetical protein [Bacillota bacterium]
MRLTPVPCEVEIHAHAGVGGTVMLGLLADLQDALRRRYAGQAQTVYLDPPFHTGKDYVLRQRCGEKGWRTG